MKINFILNFDPFNWTDPNVSIKRPLIAISSECLEEYLEVLEGASEEQDIVPSA